MAEATNCTMEPVRKSIAPPNFFCHSVPAVMNTTERNEKNMPSGVPSPKPSFSQTTRVTPAKPSASPAHWRPVTRSPRKGAANTAVSSG